VLLLVVLVLVIVFIVPHHDYSSDWGYGPSGLVSFLLFLFVVYMLVDGRGFHAHRYW
jgi:hypothetical protein